MELVTAFANLELIESSKNEWNWFKLSLFVFHKDGSVNFVNKSQPLVSSSLVFFVVQVLFKLCALALFQQTQKADHIVVLLLHV